MNQGPIVIVNADVFDGTGTDTRPADVLVEGNRIIRVAGRGEIALTDATVIDGAGATLMPGLVEAHTHIGFGSTVDRIVKKRQRSAEEQMILSAQAGRVLLEAGFTSCYSGGGRHPKIEMTLRDEFDAGWLPGPRLRCASWEGAAGELEPGVFTYDQASERPSDPAAVTAFVNRMADMGVDIVKMSLSGESALLPFSSQTVTFNDDEVAAAGRAAKERGVWLTAHAHATESIKMAVRHGYRAIYHCTWADEEALDMMGAARDRIFVSPAPGINWANLNAESKPPVSDSNEQEITVERVKLVMPELHKRGVRVLPGGDYGFWWNPVGQNARDLRLFVEWFGFTPAEALTAATMHGGQMMDMEVGWVKEGYLADLLLVSGNPLNDVSILENKDNLEMIMKDGRLYKTPAARVGSRVAAHV
jgi:imidazolonepropionase-like amidohydrolase